MLKNKSKILIGILVILLLISTISFATDTPVTTSLQDNTVSTLPGDNAKTTEGETDATDSTDNADAVTMHDGDLYLTGSNLVMDQIVDGNVYIVGGNVEITGKVNGNLFVLANTVTVQKGSYVVQAIYACANQMTFNGTCTDLYTTGNNITIGYDAFMLRDMKIAVSSLNFSGGVGRNADVFAKAFIFNTEEDNSGLVYGNLNYTSESELNLSTSYVQGNMNYTKATSFNTETVQDTIYEYVINFLRVLLLTLVIYLLAIVIAPKFMEKTSSYVSSKLAPAFGIGILITLFAPIVSIILMFIPVTSSIGISLLGLWGLLITISLPIVSIVITSKLKEKFNFTKTYQVLLILVATLLVLWILSQIPYLGLLVTLLVLATSFGIIFMHLFMKNYDSKSKDDKKTNTIEAK